MRLRKLHFNHGLKKNFLTNLKVFLLRLLLRKAWQVIDDENSSEKAKLDSRQFALECYKLQRDMIIDKTNIEEGRAVYLRSTGRLETLESLKERQAREVYEEQRRRSEAVF